MQVKRSRGDSDQKKKSGLLSTNSAAVFRSPTVPKGKETEMILSKNASSTPPLYMALELDNSRWQIGFSTAMAQPMRARSVVAGDVSSLQQEISRAIARLFPQSPPGEIVSCYEAGRDGFWIHRLLTEQGHPLDAGLASIPIHNVIVDASSMSITRQARRAKTDSIDRAALLRHLIRWNEGETHVWRVIRVPSRENENARLLDREIETLTQDRTRERNRIGAALKLHGVGARPKKTAELETLRAAEGKPLPPDMVAMLRRGFERLVLIESQIKALETERSQRLTLPTRDSEMSRRLMELKGLGEIGSSLLVHEMFAWRDFQNRREVGSAAGLCPTPYASGGSHREQGISRAGNRRVRKMMNQLAWIWIRNQPDSPITRWFEQRFAKGGPRARKIGITGAARKLLVALWRYLDQGVVPEGAILKQTKIAKIVKSKSGTETNKNKSRSPRPSGARRLKEKPLQASAHLLAPMATQNSVEPGLQ
jgi:transposase